MHADLLELPPNVIGQVVFGVLHAHPRPAPRHVRASTALGEELGPPFNRGKGGPGGGWIILDEPEVHLGQHVVVSDLAGWRREGMPELPVDKAYIDLPPDWACEVLSPSTTALDRGDKRRIYAAFGVAHLWLADPEPKTLELYELSAGSYRVVDVHAGDAHVRAVPFEAVELELGALWLR